MWGLILFPQVEITTPKTVAGYEIIALTHIQISIELKMTEIEAPENEYPQISKE